MDVRDQQQVNVDIRDQLQQLNQRLATIAEEAEYKKCKELHADQISPLNMSSSETTGIDAIDAMDMVQTMSSHGVKEAQTTLEKKSMSSSELIGH
ncbi:hypothetical protein OS493_010430 [Desmophyllum pertusum]|uniref:Uncharacterized protein n=1 Tax=Desmophyllum pertusum TaxID=174260 RepID=A0A9X0DCA3_9CNID|nr:hypothetical protein OS493_010430 [Desmophyllum pertusum]